MNKGKIVKYVLIQEEINKRIINELFSEGELPVIKNRVEDRVEEFIVNETPGDSPKVI